MTVEDLAQRLFGGIKEGIQAIGDAAFKGAEKVASVTVQGLGEAADRMVPHGASELAAALFSGSPYIMYQRGSHDQPKQEESPSPEVHNPEITQSKGLSM